jgi:xanthine dehydrogenase YagR molybdenum-binding subunit
VTSVTGRSVARVEGGDKVTGRATYTADVMLPGAAHAVLVPSQIAHGSVDADSLRLATEIASAAEGVLTVLTPLNCPRLGAPPADMSDDLPLERRPPLADLSVQHVGQHLAVVVAETLEQATEAAASFDVTYCERPARTSAHRVLAEDPGSANAWVRHGNYRPDHFVKLTDEKLQDRRGPAAEPTDGVRISACFTTKENTHYPIELSATVAFWEGDHVTIHDTTRWITGERRALAAYLGIADDHIRILAPLVGGAFGSKSFLWMHVALCAVAAREVARPVKLVVTRSQMFSSTGHRPRTEQHVTLVADTDGTLLSTEHHTLTETSTVAHFCEPAGLSARFLYESPRLVVSHEVARINSPTPCFMRGPGEAPGLFALESAMDELAYAASLDPVELRLRNASVTDQPTGRPWANNHLAQCFERGAELFGWQDRSAAPRSMRRAGRALGWGTATATYPGRRMAASCRVITTADDRVVFASATHEVGTGVRTVMAQIAADAAELPFDRVVFESGDSEFPDAPYSGASQTSASVGSAVHAAGVEWRRRRESGEDLNFTVGSGAIGRGAGVSQSFGAHFCELEIDERIGRISVTRWVAVLDCGRVLNPRLARNQVMGGVLFGLGMALMERVSLDPNTSQLIGEYYVPTHADAPHFHIEFVDTPDFDLDPIGVRGIGEIGACGVPAAIANAVFHATGKRLRELPITPEKLMIPFDTESD